MSNNQPVFKRHPVLSYYVLTFALSYAPLLVMMISRGLPPTKEQMNIFVLYYAIPFMLLGPLVSGLLMTGLVDGRPGFRDLGLRLRRWRTGPGWYFAALFLPIALNIAVPMTLSLFSPVYLPGILTTADKTSRLITNLTAAVAVGICEEIGWMGFVAPKLRQRYSSLKTGLIMGVLWGTWHILPMAVLPSAAYAPPVSPALYVALRSIFFLVGGLVSFRVLMLWVYDNTQSLPVMILMHIALTGTNMLFAPDSLAGMSNFVADFAGILAGWAAVAIVFAAFRRRPSRGLPEAQTA